MYCSEMPEASAITTGFDIGLAVADWDAKPTMAAKTPAPVNKVLPYFRKDGMYRKMTMMAIR